MRRFLYAMLAATAVLWAAVAVFVLATLPPAADEFTHAERNPRLAWGAYHVHSLRSDGSGTVDQIAAAAARSGLQFVVLTDHGDATRPPDPPAYLHGVLMIDAVEVGTEGGHVVALDLRNASPYPLAGEARDVVEDIRRQGGFAIAAHPDSPTERMRWRANGVRLDGFEWLNMDSEWRSRPATALLAAAARSLVRGPEAIASLVRSPAGLRRMDAGPGGVALAAVDAHARLGADVEDDGNGRRSAIRFPSYETLFRTLVQAVILDDRLAGDAESDARAVLSALRQGRTYSVMRGLIDTLPAVEFQAVSGGGRAAMGERLPSGAGASVSAACAVPGVEIVLLRNGREVARGTRAVSFSDPDGRAKYRLQIHTKGSGVPWVVTNSIDVGAGAEAPAGEASRPPGAPRAAPGLRVDSAAWQIERDPGSSATLTPLSPGEVRLEYRLGGGRPAGQYVAIAVPASAVPALEAVRFLASSDRPMRLSVQVRVPGGRDGQRWRRSVFIDPLPREVNLRLSDLEPIDRRSPLRPIVARIQSLLLVVDTVNARPGSGGAVTVSGLELLPGDTGGR